MKKLIAIIAFMLLTVSTAWAQEGRHYVLQGDDALVPIGITEQDTLELDDYHGDWNRFSNLDTFVLSPDAHIDYKNVREIRNRTITNTNNFVNNGRITLLGKPIKIAQIPTGSADEPSQSFIDIRSGLMIFENITYMGNGRFVLPVVEAMNPNGSPAGINAVAGKLIFDGGTLAAPIYITLEYPQNGLPFASSEIIQIRGISLENALNPDMAVVLENPIFDSTRLRLNIKERINDGITTYIWTVETIK